MSISQKSIQYLFNTLSSSKKVLIGTHLNPDGDAVGSALAISHYLDSLLVPNEVILHHPVPHNLRFLPGSERIMSKPESDYFDAAVVLDLNNLQRLGSTGPYFENIETLFIIDHHVLDGALRGIHFIDSSSPATGLLLTELFMKDKVDITAEMATCLLAGIFTDTGGFRYPNTTPECLKASAQLIKRGGDLKLIADQVYLTKSIYSLRFLGLALDHMKTSHNDQLAWSILSQDIFRQVGGGDEYTEGIVSELLTLDSVKIAAIFRETRPNFVRVSLRSREGYDVSAIARRFGGGGHRNAAGCTFEMSVEEAEDMVLGALGTCLESSS